MPLNSVDEKAERLRKHRRWQMPLALAIIVIAVGVRFLHLQADPPDWYLTGDTGYHVDEGYKTLSAKNLYVFGKVRWDPDDDYKFWIYKNPATQYPIYWTYEFLGLDLSHARYISLAYTILFFLLTAAFLRHRVSGIALILVTVLISTDLAIFQFSRVALFEAAQIFCLYGSIYLMTLVDKRSHLLALVLLLMGAFLTSELIKAQAPLYFFPAICALIVSSLLSKPLRHTGILVVAGLVGVCSLLYYFRHVWLERLEIGAVLLSPQSIFYSPLFALTPVIGLVAYLVIIDFVLRDPKALYLDSYRVSLAAIVVGSPILLSFVDYNPPRYYAPVIPAAILVIGDWFQMRSDLPRVGSRKLSAFDIAVLGVVAGSFIMLALSSLSFWYAVLLGKTFSYRYPDIYNFPILLKLFWGAAAIVAATVYALRKVIRKTGMIPLIYVGITVHMFTGILFQWLALDKPTFQARDIEQKLITRIGPDESVGGDWAPMLTASSRLRSYYINTKFNRPDGYSFVEPTFFLYAGTYDDQKTMEMLQRDSRFVIGNGELLGTYFKKEIRLYRLSRTSISAPASHPL